MNDVLWYEQLIRARMRWSCPTGPLHNEITMGAHHYLTRRRFALREAEREGELNGRGPSRRNCATS